MRRTTTAVALLAVFAGNAAAQEYRIETLPRIETGLGIDTADGLEQERQQPRRQTRRYAKYGAIAGGAAGFLVGSYMALWCSGTQEDGCLVAIPMLTAFGVLSGAAGGAIIGAAIPAPGVAGAPAPARGRAIASGGLSAGVAQASITGFGSAENPNPPPMEGTGPAARFNVYAHLKPWFGLGPELGIAGFGDAGDVRHIAVAARFTGDGRIAPFATVNLGAYESTAPSLEYLGGGVGVGARLTPTARNFFVETEARHARNAQNIEPMRMWTLSVSGGFYW